MNIKTGNNLKDENMFSRRKKISLAQFEDRWVNSFVEVRMTGMQQILNQQIAIGKVSKELQKLDQNDNSDETETKAMQLSQELIDKTIDIIRSRFVGGMVFDENTNEDRQLSIDEIGEFDNEVLKYIISQITGSVPKD